MKNLFVTGLRVRDEIPKGSYLNSLGVMRHLQDKGELALDKRVTFFVGENGTGKSTLLEGLAVNYGFNPEGGSIHLRFATQDTHSGLWAHMTVVKGAKRPRDGYFLRAESFYNVASAIDEIDEDGSLISSYGGASLHQQSHGESFMALVTNRFGGNGLYILDEPEAALSPSRQMALLVLIHRLAGNGSQFIIATHSPILMAYPGADIYALDASGIGLTAYKETEHYRLTHQFLQDPERILHLLLDEE